MQVQPSEVPEFEFRRGDLMVLPYYPTTGVYKADTLLRLYDRLNEEGLWTTVFHENPAMTLTQFINFFNDIQTTLLQICSVTEGDRVVDIAGMAWVSDITSCDEALTRAQGSFVFFKDWQKPQYTDAFARMILDFWFKGLHLDVIVGITPSRNRAATAFIKRNGFATAGYLERFTSFEGQPDDAVISVMQRTTYLGGSNGEGERKEGNFSS